VATCANLHNEIALPAFLHGEERIVQGDKVYFSDANIMDATERAVFCGVLD
jgi:hypothetical protein